MIDPDIRSSNSVGAPAFGATADNRAEGRRSYGASTGRQVLVISA